MRVIAVLLLFCSIGFADEAVEIPLSEIWALDIPGTQDIRDLEGAEKFHGMKMAEIIDKSLVENTKSALSSRHWPSRGQGAGAGFIVVGTGLEALEEANAVLVKKKERPDTLPAGKELTLVFYSYMSGRYVRLDRVVKSNRDVKIEYHFEAHAHRAFSTHFALIPVGKFTPGMVDVRIERLSDTETSTPLTDERVKQLVCESFSFQVE